MSNTKNKTVSGVKPQFTKQDALNKLKPFKGAIMSTKEVNKILTKNLKCSSRTSYRLIEELQRTSNLTSVSLLKIK